MIGSVMNYVSWLVSHKYGTSHDAEDDFADISNLQLVMQDARNF